MSASPESPVARDRVCRFAPDLDVILDRLEQVRQTGPNQWQALCPAHKDSSPSLSIAIGDDGRLLLYCHAGCAFDAVVAALGIDRPPPHQQANPTSKKRWIVATYGYCDVSGSLLYQKVRYRPKDFRIRRPDGASGWIWRLDDVPRVLYRLLELRRAIEQGQTVFFPEGEKDCDRLVSLGLAATTNVEGAAQEGQRAKWRREYTEQLTGAQRVVLLPDNDAPGHAHMQAVARALAGTVADVRLLELPGLAAKGDVSDWLASDHTLDELLELVEQAKPYQAPPPKANPKPAHYTLDAVIAVFREYLYLPDPGPLQFDLGVVLANYFPGDAVWGLKVGAPGSGKTETLNGLSNLPAIRAVATLTVSGLLSGTSKRDKSQTAKGGLLREIGEFGIIALKDFGSILSMHRDARAELLAALREIYDGSWTRYVGTDGGQCLHWSGKVGLVGCSTPTIDQAHGVMGALGERFVLYRMPAGDHDERALTAFKRGCDSYAMRKEMAVAVAGLIENTAIPDALPASTPADEIRFVALAGLTATARSAVIRDGYQREIELIPGPEVPTRLVIMLSKLYQAFLLLGMTPETAWALVKKVALDSMPQIRRTALEMLIKHSGEMTTTEIATAAGYPTQTTRRALEDLTCYQVLERQSGGDGKSDKWRVSEWTRAKWNALTFPELSGKYITQKPSAANWLNKSEAAMSCHLGFSSKSTASQAGIGSHSLLFAG